MLLGIGIIVASFQDFGTLPVSQMPLNVLKEPKEKCQEDVTKTGNGYHQDPDQGETVLQ